MSFVLDEEKTFVQRDFNLDKKLIKALSKLGYTYPTLVQAKAIPIALQGKDLLVRARTGSGKTVAFALPLINKILIDKYSETSNSLSSSQAATGTNKVRGLVLAPTKELCKQIDKNMGDLIYYCKDIVSICSLVESDNDSVIKYKLQSKPDIIVSTPARLVQQLKAGTIDISSVGTLIIDEADLILSFGYSGDVQTITAKLPKIFQGIFMSATLSPELEKFKKIVLHNPAVLKLEEAQGSGNLLQFTLRSTEDDKYLVLYVFLKLGLLQGKGLIFANDVNKCYKIKLFLQQFFISAAVLSPELPVNSRLHMLDEYNRGVFDYLIATDTSIDQGEQEEEEEGEEEGGDGDDNDDDKESDNNDNDEETVTKNKKESKTLSSSSSSSSPSKRKRSTEDKEYGVSRGIDFQGVAFVINFDFPLTPSSYTHRAGRTARGEASGTALSFITIHDPQVKGGDLEVAERDEEVLQLVRQQQPRLGSVDGNNILAAVGSVTDDPSVGDENRMQPAPLLFNMKELDSFRYRVTDTLRSVTAAAVKELRVAEIKREILNSTQLKSYFAENPNDLKVLRHDKSIIHPIKQKDHLKNLPNYLIPLSMRSVANTSSTTKKKRRKTEGQANRIKKSKLKDPLLGTNAATGASSGDNANGDDDLQEIDDVDVASAERIFTSNDSLGASMAGRVKWQQRHKKGKFKVKGKSKKKSL